MCDCPDKDIKFPKWSCVLNYCSECTDVFVPDAEMNFDEDVDLPFIYFCFYQNIISCPLHKNILPEHGKTCPSCMNLEIFDKVKVTTRKILVLKSCNNVDFNSEYYIP